MSDAQYIRCSDAAEKLIDDLVLQSAVVTECRMMGRCTPDVTAKYRAALDALREYIAPIETAAARG